MQNCRNHCTRERTIIISESMFHSCFLIICIHCSSSLVQVLGTCTPDPWNQRPQRPRSEDQRHFGRTKGLGAQKKVTEVKIYMIFAVFAFYGQRTKTDFKDQACTDDCNSSRDKSFHKNSVLSNSTKMWSFTIATGSFCVPGGYLKHTQRQLVCYTSFYLWQIKTGVFYPFKPQPFPFFWTGPFRLFYS